MNKFIITAAMILATSAASAGDISNQKREQIAKSLFEQGMSAYQTGDYQSAAELYTQSIQNWATAEATANLCSLYYKGEGVDQVFSVALQFCKIAASKNSPAAMNLLAEMYLQGNGIEKDIEQAKQYLQRAAALGNTHAQSLLAKIEQQQATQKGPGQVSRVDN